MISTARRPMSYSPRVALPWTVDAMVERPVVRRGPVVVVPTVCTKATPVDRATCLVHAERLAAALNRIYGVRLDA